MYNSIEEQQGLLKSIEENPDSFTAGRRNNDLVNWVLVNLMISKTEGGEEEVVQAHELVNRFVNLMPSLSDEAIESLQTWEVVFADKIQTVWLYYHLSTVEDLKELLIDCE